MTRSARDRAACPRLASVSWGSRGVRLWLCLRRRSPLSCACGATSGAQLTKKARGLGSAACGIGFMRGIVWIGICVALVFIGLDIFVDCRRVYGFQRSPPCRAGRRAPPRCRHDDRSQERVNEVDF